MGQSLLPFAHDPSPITTRRCHIPPRSFAAAPWRAADPVRIAPPNSSQRVDRHPLQRRNLRGAAIMIKKALVTAVAIAVTSGVAHAGENKFTKEEGTGMLTGAAAGAVVGGPIGAAIGFMFGGILGDSIGTANRA